LKDQREIINRMVTQEITERRACEVAGFNRSSIRYQAKGNPLFSEAIKNKVLYMANTYKCQGYKTITTLMKRLGYIVNKKRVFRIWQEYALGLPVRKKRKKSIVPWERPHKATRINEVWCHDFLFTRTEHGDLLKIYVVLDEYSRECLAIKVSRKINSEDVKEVLEGVLNDRSKPEYIRSDNGPEFISKNLRKWYGKREIRTQYIEPGKPWQNGFVESFNSRFRAECLNREMFWSRGEAQTVCSWWRQVYNYFRPHSSLGYKTPKEMASGAAYAPLRQPQNLDKYVSMVY